MSMSLPLSSYRRPCWLIGCPLPPGSLDDALPPPPVSLDVPLPPLVDLLGGPPPLTGLDGALPPPVSLDGALPPAIGRGRPKKSTGCLLRLLMGWPLSLMNCP